MFAIESAPSADLQGETLVTAFPTVGMVGTIATGYLAEALKMKRTAYVISDDIPPAAIVQDGIPSYPLRVLSHKKISVLAAEFQIPMQYAGQMAKTILDWADEKDYGLIVCLEGIMMDRGSEDAKEDKEKRVFGVGSTEKARTVVADAGIEQFKAGVITGVSGALLSEGERRGRDVICLLADANAMYPDAKGAAKLLEQMAKALPSLKIDIEELHQEAERIEENVKATVERAKELLAARQGQAERLGKSYMYG